MDSKLDLIITQNWALLALLLVLVIMSAFCGYQNLKKAKGSEERLNLGLGELWDKGEYENVEKVASDILEKYPNHVEGLYFLGKVLAQRGENDEAIELWEKARKSDPQLYISIGNLIETTRQKDAT